MERCHVNPQPNLRSSAFGFWRWIRTREALSGWLGGKQSLKRAQAGMPVRVLKIALCIEASAIRLTYFA